MRTKPRYIYCYQKKPCS